MSPLLRPIVVLFLIACVTRPALSSPTPLSPEKETQLQQIVLQEVNRYRQSKGMNKLVLSDVLSKEAKQHSFDMASKKMTFGHQDFDKRIAHIKREITNFGGGAENIAWYKIPPNEVVKKWLTSRGHKRNIEGRYNLTGIGVVQDERGWIYYTQIFVKDNQIG